MKSSVLMLSGGLDSAVTAAQLSSSQRLFPIFVDYGQAAAKEEHEAAIAIASYLDLAPLRVVPVPFPSRQAEIENAAAPDYPYRNALLSILGATYANEIGAEEVIFGFVRDTEQEGIFLDSTLRFLQSLESTLGVGYRDVIHLSAPSAASWKVDLVRWALSTDFPIDRTYSCYRGGTRCRSCGGCLAVQLCYERLGVVAGATTA